MRKKKFEKFHNRSMPLFSVQYWYRGEYYELPQVTNNQVRWNPLFVYRKGCATDIYYDINDPQTWDISYFKDHPKKFEMLVREYERECAELLRIVKRAKPKDFSKIYNLHLSAWLKLDMVVVLGELVNEKGFEQIAQKSCKIRYRTDRVEYISGNNLVDLSKQILPDYKNFIYFLTFEEIANKVVPSRKELRERKKGYIYFEGEIYTGLTAKQFAKLKDIEISEKTTRNIKDSILRGTIAMTGKIRGRVRKIFEEKQLNRVRKGDILVTPMTTPNYIIAMRKASAFITDEGGLTCHAAIVAREFKKPCIIGTKIATQSLKDGDLVEVNADKGVVRILKRNE